MSERENNVYKAKLAEQAERYDGELLFARFASYLRTGGDANNSTGCCCSVWRDGRFSIYPPNTCVWVSVFIRMYAMAAAAAFWNTTDKNIPIQTKPHSNGGRILPFTRLDKSRTTSWNLATLQPSVLHCSMAGQVPEIEREGEIVHQYFKYYKDLYPACVCSLVGYLLVENTTRIESLCLLQMRHL